MISPAELDQLTPSALRTLLGALPDAWLESDFAAELQKRLPPDTCTECGSSLAHVAGGGVEAVLCPVCDSERLYDLTEEAAA